MAWRLPQISERLPLESRLTATEEDPGWMNLTSSLAPMLKPPDQSMDAFPDAWFTISVPAEASSNVTSPLFTVPPCGSARTGSAPRSIMSSETRRVTTLKNAVR